MLKIILKVLFWIIVGWLIWLVVKVYQVAKQEGLITYGDTEEKESKDKI